ncbi:hypothetical protein E1A91_D01G003700v1 [Gossypium mustelinum]|uniref:Dirigent protein n=1 Tax=Gossypium mustelinum TaxID=34275 RepID=A0A5D2W1Y9_GOSMU|nr:hypothetical protein E1A91_D01G003700v1 [Gossypium mustelinum]
MENLAILLLVIFLVAMPMAYCVKEGAEEVDEWFDKLPYAKQKVTKLHFFFHDRFAGKHNRTAVRVAHGPETDKSPTSFGLVFIMDDPLTERMNPTSKELGRAQGLYAFSGQDELSLLMSFNLVFTTGEFNGSTLTVLGRNPAVPHREMPIVGGSGVFRMARGVASAKLRSFNMTTVSMGEVDQAFIQSIEHRANLDNIEIEGIPLIDLSLSHTTDINLLVSEIGNACKNWGFFQVINHGVPLELLEKIKVAAKAFFDQPVEEKRKVKRDEVNAMGYHESEHTKNVRDWKEVFDFLIKDPSFLPASPETEDDEIRTLSNQWPETPPQFREVCQTYAREVEKLGYKLLELISLSLGLPSNRLNGYFEDHTTMMRLNHYPPCPCPELALGVGRHKDAGTLTIVAQDDVGGLQVRRKSDDVWVPVKPTPNALVINVGDTIQVWSNEAYESVEHRVVVNSERERFSIPVFFFPSHYVMVKPLEELVNEGNPPKYKPYNFGKFFVARNRSDYKKLEVQNIQISDFKII